MMAAKKLLTERRLALLQQENTGKSLSALFCRHACLLSKFKWTQPTDYSIAIAHGRCLNTVLCTCGCVCCGIQPQTLKYTVLMPQQSC